MKVIDQLNSIKAEIAKACARVNRNPEDIKILAVTKYVSADRAKEAMEAGIMHLGENRAEGLREKWNVLKDKPTWHFIGTLQSRKVKDIIDKVDYIHSLDRLSLAKEIQERAGERVISCFIQVNVSGEESKHGLKSEMVIPFIESLKEFNKLKIVGLMTMAPLTTDDRFLRICFRDLKRLQVEIKKLELPYAPCDELSMGMSNDFDIAIEEGATIIRIGTSLVG